MDKFWRSLRIGCISIFAVIALGKGANVVSASYLDSEPEDTGSLLVVTDSNLVKKVPVGQYPQKGRATAGVVTTELVQKEHILLTMLINEEDYLLFTASGTNGEQVTAVKASGLKAFTRARKGVPQVEGRIIHVVRL